MADGPFWTTLGHRNIDRNRIQVMKRKMRRKQNEKRKLLTFAATVWTTEDGALLYCAKGSKQLSDIVFGLLFAEHPHEQLSVCELSLAECRK